MDKGRLEAFSDGVIAIIITIMVLELRPPHGFQFRDLRELAPTALSYALSFTYVGIYWNNHHHMLNVAQSVNGAILWANMHLLFWLSLNPFVTAWLGENPLATAPVALYGGVQIMCAVAYTILSQTLIHREGPDSVLARATGADRKGKLSLALYAAAVAVAFYRPTVSLVLYLAVAMIWFIPDKRIERTLEVS